MYKNISKNNFNENQKVKKIISKVSNGRRPTQDSRQVVENYIEKKVHETNNIGQFDPLGMAKVVLLTNGIFYDNFWQFAPDKGIYYSYNNGVWKIRAEQNLKNKVYELLGHLDPKFNRKSKANVIIENIKRLISNEQISKKFEGINQSKKYINLKNGMLDIKSKKLKKHDPSYYSIFRIPVVYDENAECPLWEEKLREWVPDRVARLFLQEYIGYLLIPDISVQTFVILKGNGANGKSVFARIVGDLLEDNAVSLSLNRFKKSNNRFIGSSLYNSLANIGADIGHTTIKDTGVLKRMTGGDKMMCEFKYKPIFPFISVCRPLFTCNKLPEIKDDSIGWLRRVRIVKFPNTFRPGDPGYDPNLYEKLIKELPGIFNWAFEGLRRLKSKNMKMTESKTMEKDRKEFLRKSNKAEEFLKEKMLITKRHEDFIPTSEVYKLFKEWCRKNDLLTMKKPVFTRRLKKKGIENKVKFIRSKSTRCYIGIRLK